MQRGLPIVMHGEARLQLSRDPTAASYARQRVGEFCGDMAPDLQATAQLLTSELVTNALRHGTGAIEMCMTVELKTVRVEVTDESPQPPRIMHPTAQSAGGRGVLLVEALASSWGTTQHPGNGKAVWFALRTA